MYLILGLHRKPFQRQTKPSRAVSLALLLFCIIFSAMLQDAFKNCENGDMIRFRSDGGIFNLQRRKARTKVSLMLLSELLFADDCRLIAHTKDMLQSILDDFARAASRYGLTISITNTRVMLQLKACRQLPSQSCH